MLEGNPLDNIQLCGAGGGWEYIIDLNPLAYSERCGISAHSLDGCDT
jgi:hypothetical protein